MSSVTYKNINIVDVSPEQCSSMNITPKCAPSLQHWTHTVVQNVFAVYGWELTWDMLMYLWVSSWISNISVSFPGGLHHFKGPVSVYSPIHREHAQATYSPSKKKKNIQIMAMSKAYSVLLHVELLCVPLSSGFGSSKRKAKIKQAKKGTKA